MIVNTNNSTDLTKIEFKGHGAKPESTVFNLIPVELFLKILSYLSLKEISKAQEVCRMWYSMGSDESLWKFPPDIQNKIIDASKYKEFLDVDVGKEPVLSHRQIKEIILTLRTKNQMLILIPDTINKEPSSLNNFEKAVRIKGQRLLCYVMRELKDKYGSKPIETSNWILVSKNLKETKNKLYEEQENIIRKELGTAYKSVTLTEAVFTTYMAKLVFGENLLPGWDETDGYFCSFTRCQEEVEQSGQKYRIIIGGHDHKGLYVNALKDGIRSNEGLLGRLKL